MCHPARYTRWGLFSGAHLHYQFHLFEKKRFLHLNGSGLESCCSQVMNEAANQITLNIGYQKYGILPIVKERAVLENALKNQNVKINWGKNFLQALSS